MPTIFKMTNTNKPNTHVQKLHTFNQFLHEDILIKHYYVHCTLKYQLIHMFSVFDNTSTVILNILCSIYNLIYSIILETVNLQHFQSCNCIVKIILIAIDKMLLHLFIMISLFTV